MTTILFNGLLDKVEGYHRQPITKEEWRINWTTPELAQKTGNPLNKFTILATWAQDTNGYNNFYWLEGSDHKLYSFNLYAPLGINLLKPRITFYTEGLVPPNEGSLDELSVQSLRKEAGYSHQALTSSDNELLSIVSPEIGERVNEKGALFVPYRVWRKVLPVGSHLFYWIRSSSLKEYSVYVDVPVDGQRPNVGILHSGYADPNSLYVSAGHNSSNPIVYFDPIHHFIPTPPSTDILGVGPEIPNYPCELGPGPVELPHILGHGPVIPPAEQTLGPVDPVLSNDPLGHGPVRQPSQIDAGLGPVLTIDPLSHGPVRHPPPQSGIVNQTNFIPQIIHQAPGIAILTQRAPTCQDIFFLREHRKELQHATGEKKAIFTPITVFIFLATKKVVYWLITETDKTYTAAFIKKDCKYELQSINHGLIRPYVASQNRSLLKTNTPYISYTPTETDVEVIAHHLSDLRKESGEKDATFKIDMAWRQYTEEIVGVNNFYWLESSDYKKFSVNFYARGAIPEFPELTMFLSGWIDPAKL